MRYTVSAGEGKYTGEVDATCELEAVAKFFRGLDPYNPYVRPWEVSYRDETLIISMIGYDSIEELRSEDGLSIKFVDKSLRVSSL